LRPADQASAIARRVGVRAQGRVEAPGSAARNALRHRLAGAMLAKK